MSAQVPPVPPPIVDEFIMSRETPEEQRERRSMSSARSLPLKPTGFRAGVGLENVARRTLGIFLLLVTVFLWTTSNFLASVCWLNLSDETLADVDSIYLLTTRSPNHISLHISTLPSSPCP